MRHMKMKELPNSSRPYERCMREGAEHLTDAELLSIILRTGSKGENSLELAERILALNCPGEGILGLLHLSLPQLMSVKGIGKVKGVQLMCIGELSAESGKRSIWKELCDLRNRNRLQHITGRICGIWSRSSFS